MNSASGSIIFAAANLVHIPKLLATGFSCKCCVKPSGSGTGNREHIAWVSVIGITDYIVMDAHLKLIVHNSAVLPTSKPFGPVLVKPDTRPGVPSGLVGLVGRALCPEQCRSCRNRYRS
jgi:hypothetical protein